MQISHRRYNKNYFSFKISEIVHDDEIKVLSATCWWCHFTTCSRELFLHESPQIRGSIMQCAHTHALYNNIFTPQLHYWRDLFIDPCETKNARVAHSKPCVIVCNNIRYERKQYGDMGLNVLVLYSVDTAV